MKKLLYLTSIISFSVTHAQVAIGKDKVTNTSVSLEFGNYVPGEGKGIIVPWVTSSNDMPTTTVDGTIVFDTADKTMKYKRLGSWVALTKNEMAIVGTDTTLSNTTGIVDTSLQGPNIMEKAEAKASIGNPSTTPGILVLEDTNKAMILPKVPNPHLNIVNPEPGLMVYDTEKNQLAIFNGNVWNFWKP